MNEFLSYDIFGIMAVQTYLIVALVDLILCAAFNKKDKSLQKLVGQALIWPLNFIVISVLFIGGCILALLALIAKIFGGSQ